ncbi:MAG: tRNA 5-methoxyuridine(34)/uridine 5-oxyacetic acid(34) synthase CmoB [Desulfarculaceae bacterium]|nr:tRNA 5-methoxyuridine(34)/uridine 5-oxyacetic acid(34) synthase CmoB [Desulfarculaceae bacterium]
MDNLLEKNERYGLKHCLPALESLIRERKTFFANPTGNAFYFNRALQDLPELTPSSVSLDSSKILIGSRADADDQSYKRLSENLFRLCPWRKGPFQVFGVDIDSEWQSWMKWDRFKHVLPDPAGKKILDIGSSNGYYMFRAAAFDPLLVLGVEPQHSFYYQYLALQKYLGLDNLSCIPAGFERLPAMDRYFDLVFCMGILYHRKSPIEMLAQIKRMMRPGGMLVLDNLVLDSAADMCLFPESRYAKMRNVFFIPDLKCMQSWLKRAGFSSVSCVDVSKTTKEEQRKTFWIQTESLADFLDPLDPDHTVEGYPAPVRAVFTACA